MSRIITKSVLALLLGCAGMAAASAYADGDPAPTYQRERAMQRYKGCHFTDEMGKYLYTCIRKNDGFGTHWCYDETLETYCPAQIAEKQTHTDAPPPPDKPSN
jgi:hypothetical protein